ncbi:MAG: hypothetical protein IPP14_08310 [Planctomycetes bacterium]|nr:hypothetical protein [Planctomycetota bacterium]
MGLIHEALPDLLRADELHRTELASKYGQQRVWGGIKKLLATVYLLLRDTESAKRELRSDMKGILDWPDCFTDAGGGVGPGLLLWYIAARAPDAALESEALTYLQDLLRKHNQPRFQGWPRHLAKFVLGQYSFAALLQDAFKCIDLDELERCAYVERAAPPPGEVPFFDAEVPPTGLLLRRHLAQALFYGGIKARLHDPALGESLLRRCVSLKDVDIENEWYLAFLELGLVGPGPSR